jgi:hypothetical protein
MYNHTAFAKAFVIAKRTLAVALLTIGMGVSSTWAESDQASGTRISSEVVFRPVIAASHPQRSIIKPSSGGFLRASISASLKTHVAQACLSIRTACTGDEQCCNRICAPTGNLGVTQCICLANGSACTDDLQCCEGHCGSDPDGSYACK